MALALKLKAATTKTPASVTKPAAAASPEASRYRDLALRMDELKTEMEIARDELLTIVNAERETKIRAGEEVTSIKVPTDDGNRVLVVYTEKFKQLDTENVEGLKEAFGAEYALLVAETEAVGFRDGTTTEAIGKTIGKAAMAKLTGLLTVKESVSPRKGASKEAARLFRQGEKGMGEDLMIFLDATLYSPQVRAK